MSRIEKTVCDTCKREVIDDCAEIGWIRIEGGLITVHDGRAANGAARSRLYLALGEKHRRDFCSLDCLATVLKGTS